MGTPSDYSKCSLEELYDVQRHIDKEKHPDGILILCVSGSPSAGMNNLDTRGAHATSGLILQDNEATQIPADTQRIKIPKIRGLFFCHITDVTPVLDAL